MADIRIGGQLRKRQPDERGATRQAIGGPPRAYVTNDPRWPEHRRKLAAAQYAPAA